MKCRSCNTKLKPFFSLARMPLVNAFLKKADLKHEKKYELATAFCPKCFLVQLTKTIPPEELFTDYLYFSSTSASFLAHCEATADVLIKRLRLGKESLVLEIASNDGAQLQCFDKVGIPILGVDPAKNIARLANSRGIPTIPEFFTHAFAIHLKEHERVTADLVFGANVLAHVPNINNFLDGVRVILAPRGTAVFEFPYLKGLLENKFDTIYHEHVFYYSLLALRNVFERSGLRIYDLELTPVQGGSLRIFASYPGAFPISKSVGELLAAELKSGYDKFETYVKMGVSVAKLKTNLLELLATLKKQDKRIAAYGAPAKGNVLLNYLGIGNKYLDFIVDKAPAKQGLYTPGMQMKVLHPRVIADRKPDYLLVLCWNIADEVVEQLRDYKKAGGKFIIPVPEIKII